MQIVGKLLRGHYQVLDVLGSGGVGETYTAADIDRPGEPKCVVKRLKPVNTDPQLLPKIRQLFKQEAETLERLGREHPLIPTLLAYFEEDQEFYLVQDFVDGQPLSIELPAGHCWSEFKVIELLKDVLTILQFVHSQGVIHRDLKPTNLIRRDADGKLVLIDFGAVKQIRDPQAAAHTQSRPMTISIGTEGYMPPEQASGVPNLSSDIYALGMIGIQALTGVEPAHLGRDPDGEVMWQHLRHTSPALAAVLIKMVRYYFKVRYQSATETLQALQSLPLNSFEKTVAPDASGRVSIAETDSRTDSNPLPSSVRTEQPQADSQTTKVAPKVGGFVATESETKVSLDPASSPKQANSQETRVSLESHLPSLTTNLSETRVSSRAIELTGTSAETKVSLDSPPKPAAVTNSSETRVSSRQLPGDSQHTKVSLNDTPITPTPSAAPNLTDNQLPLALLNSNRNLGVMIFGGGIAVIVCAVGLWFLFQSNQSPDRAVIAPSPVRSAQPSTTGRSTVVTELEKYPSYVKLRDSLQAKNWSDADRQTYELMLQLAGSKSTENGLLVQEEWKKISCDKFQEIDRLWHEASGGTLGFDAQLQIFKTYFSETDIATQNFDKSKVRKYYEEIGWTDSSGRAKFILEIDPSAPRIRYTAGVPDFKQPPPGHLPAQMAWNDGQGKISPQVQTNTKAYACR